MTSPSPGPDDDEDDDGSGGWGWGDALDVRGADGDAEDPDLARLRADRPPHHEARD